MDHWSMFTLIIFWYNQMQSFDLLGQTVWPSIENIIFKCPQRLNQASNQKVVLTTIDQWPILHLNVKFTESENMSKKIGSPYSAWKIGKNTIVATDDLVSMLTLCCITKNRWSSRCNPRCSQKIRLQNNTEKYRIIWNNTE